MTNFVTDPMQYAQAPQRDKSTAPSQQLGKDDFLNLLMVQLRNQNPLDVQDNKEFIAQMAQFSNLEQTTNLNVSMQNLVGFEQMTQGAALIGKTVQAQVLGSDSEDPQVITGVVDESRMVNGKIQLMVKGQAIDYKNILSIRDGGK